MKYYWGTDEETAVVLFNQMDDIEGKHVIYVNTIEPAFQRLVENIYYSYNFNKTLYDYDSIKHEAITHLYEKLNRYNPGLNKKSYSYFGTIVKNWLIQQSNSFKKQVFIDGDSRDGIIHDLSITHYDTKVVESESKNLINKVVSDLIEIIGDQNNVLTIDDNKVLSIVIEVLKEYQILDITNKKQLYVYVREATDLPSRKITKSLNKIRGLYSHIKLDFIEG
mgnify:CR=1 FL=1|jgi:hypothetical protein|tara:strand:+ start:1473 stop:2138 length:666 start_codon:yes stop_codon:yes gene_type:complete